MSHGDTRLDQIRSAPPDLLNLIDALVEAVDTDRRGGGVLMARRYGLSFWVAILLFAATFVSAPRDTAELSWDVFRGVGQFGGAVVSELVSSDAIDEAQ